jgi:hypothetical protein
MENQESRLRDPEAAEVEFGRMLEEWQAKHELEDYEVTDIVLRQWLHYWSFATACIPSILLVRNSSHSSPALTCLARP